MLRYTGWKGLLRLLLGLAVFIAPLARAQEPVDSHVRIVRLSYREGDVQLISGQGSGSENATLNTPITEGNQLRTADGRAEVQFEDGSTIRIAPDSQLTFTQLARLSSGAAVTSVDLENGEAEFQVSRHDDDGVFAVHVGPRVIALKHSSHFRVTNTSSEPLQVVVWKGEVVVRDPDSGKEISVKKNETFSQDALDAGRYDLEKGIDADELDQWSAQREDYLNRYSASNSGYSGFSNYQYGTSDLNYYGQYYNIPGYGYLWQPNGVNLGWDPFANGWYTYSPQFGYMWVSAYPWGWVPFHYGHWIFVQGYGWLWQPGNFANFIRSPRIVNPPAGFHAPVPPAAGARASGPVGPSGNGFVGNASGTPGSRSFSHIPGDRRVITNDDFPDRGNASQQGQPANGGSQNGRNDAGRDFQNRQHANGNDAAPRRMESPSMHTERPVAPQQAPMQHNEAAPQQHSVEPRTVTPPPSRPPMASAPVRTYSPPAVSRPAPAMSSAPRSLSPPPAALHSAPSSGGRVR